MKTGVDCIHIETMDNGTHIGPCRRCRQRRQYDPGGGFKPPVVIERGYIDGNMTHVTPTGRTPPTAPTPAPAAPPAAAPTRPTPTRPTPGEKAGRPKRWAKWDNHRKARWIDEHREEILADYHRFGRPGTEALWGIGKSTLRNALVRWEALTPPAPVPDQVSPETEPVPDVAPVEDDVLPEEEPRPPRRPYGINYVRPF